MESIHAFTIRSMRLGITRLFINSRKVYSIVKLERYFKIDAKATRDRS